MSDVGGVNNKGGNPISRLFSQYFINLNIKHSIFIGHLSTKIFIWRAVLNIFENQIAGWWMPLQTSIPSTCLILCSAKFRCQLQQTLWRLLTFRLPEVSLSSVSMPPLKLTGDSVPSTDSSRINLTYRGSLILFIGSASNKLDIITCALFTWMAMRALLWSWSGWGWTGRWRSWAGSRWSRWTWTWGASPGRGRGRGRAPAARTAAASSAPGCCWLPGSRRRYPLLEHYIFQILFLTITLCVDVTFKYEFECDALVWSVEDHEEHNNASHRGNFSAEHRAHWKHLWKHQFVFWAASFLMRCHFTWAVNLVCWCTKAESNFSWNFHKVHDSI